MPRGRQLAAPAPAACVHQRSARQARRTPGRVALESEDRTVTYAQLLAAAAGLAGRLAEIGVSRGSLVGVCAERSPELVAGMLGVLMAGGAYVPLDPAYP